MSLFPYYPEVSDPWGLVRLLPTESGCATDVSVWTGGAVTDLDVYVYDTFDGSAPTALLGQRLNASFQSAGYHTVQLSSPVTLTAGNDVYVAVKFGQGSGTGGFPVDSTGPVSPGNSYSSASGAANTWYDLAQGAGASLVPCDIGIRLLVGPCQSATLTPTPTRTVTATPSATATPSVTSTPTRTRTPGPTTPVTPVALPLVLKAAPPTAQPTRTPTRTATPRSWGTIASANDTQLHSGYPYWDYSGYMDLTIGYVDPSYPEEAGITRSLFYFDLSGLPQNAYIHSATLRLYLSWIVRPGLPHTALTAHRIKRTWPVTPNWSNFANACGEEHGSVAASSDPEIPIRTLVQGWVSGTWPNYGVMVLGPESGSTNQICVFSGDSSAWQPELSVTYQPVAGSGPLHTYRVKAEAVPGAGVPLASAPPEGAVVVRQID
ncbi:MAG: DNRLRE domain-containing protein [Chloroflexi bacterium]|nr:DNRLRE domain-containing protein [Chloroflexota bacterium]